MADLSLEKVYTADDLAELSTGMGKRYELIEGRLIEMSPAGGKHGNVAATISGFIFMHIFNNPVGKVVTAETGFYTRGDKRTVRAPDYAFIHNDKIPEDGIPEGFLSIVPDLVVEVVSPNDRASEIDAKTQEWLNFGVTLVWVIYPNTEKVVIYEQGQASAPIKQRDDVLDSEGVLPGFSAMVGRIFE